MRGASLRFAIGALAALAAATGALAGDEAPCAEQYSLEEHLMLEWAALAGDPHAQFAVAQCALPEGSRDLTPAQTAYALKWVTLAACDATGADDIGARDRRSRRLKAKGDISFRRFHEIDQDESLSRKERRFVEYREHKTKELMKRLKRLNKLATPTEFDFARAEIAEELSRFGARGQVRLASLSSCKHLNAPASFIAAAWAAAADAWDREWSRGGVVYGSSERSDWSFREEAETRAADLSGKELAQYQYQLEWLKRFEPSRLEALEAEAALARLGELRTLQTVEFAPPAEDDAAAAGDLGMADADAADAEKARDLLLVAAGLEAADIAPSEMRRANFAGPSVTIATQYALEALGFMEFVNGPDNDYGPSTIEAVAKAQREEGHVPTRWASHREVRDMVCRAATEAEDPVSYFNLATMFLRGQGYPRQLAKSQYALDQAEALIEVKLIDADALPEWKADQYPTIRAEIKAARSELEEAWRALPPAVRAEMSSWRPIDEPLCR